VVEGSRLVCTNYAVRTGAFAYSFLVIGLHLCWRAMRSAHPAHAELDNLRVAVLRVSGTGKPRELALRLVDRLRESEERLLLAGHALEGMTEAIIITGADGVVQTVNRAFCEITGYEREEVLGQPEKAIRHGLQPAEFYDDIYATVAREGHWSGTLWSRRKSGSVYREWRSIRAVRDAEGATTHYVIVFFEARGAHDEDSQLRKRRG